MTDLQYNLECLIDRIVNSTVEPPKDVTSEYLDGWLSGAATRQNEIIDIIEKMQNAED